MTMMVMVVDGVTVVRCLESLTRCLAFFVASMSNTTRTAHQGEVTDAVAMIPTELMEHIIALGIEEYACSCSHTAHFTHYSFLATCAQVCSTWRDICYSPHLWRQLHFTPHTPASELQNVIQTLVKTGRVSRLKTLHLSHNEHLTDQMLYLLLTRCGMSKMSY